MSDRDDAGRFEPGNTAALTHGGRSCQVAAGELPGQAVAVAAAGERQAAILADLGGDVSALQASQVETFARLEVVADFLWQTLQTKGPLTPKGRQRAALTAWLKVVDRMQRIATGLGMERRAKRVPSIDEYLHHGRVELTE